VIQKRKGKNSKAQTDASAVFRGAENTSRDLEPPRLQKHIARGLESIGRTSREEQRAVQGESAAEKPQSFTGAQAGGEIAIVPGGKGGCCWKPKTVPKEIRAVAMAGG